MKKLTILLMSLWFSFALSSCIGDEEPNKDDNTSPDIEQTPSNPNEETPDNANKPITGTSNGYDYVDLGLPSGTMWATCNVGADSPEDYGDYFAWSETTTKQEYSWDTYTFSGNPAQLELTDDAARANMGGKWRMPTKAEQDELRTECTWTWGKKNGVSGYTVKSKTNGKSIFLPAAGGYDGSTLDYAGSGGYYWSSTLNSSYTFSACRLGFNSGGVDWRSNFRYYGLSVRGVFK